jgi:hypothetical protein
MGSREPSNVNISPHVQSYIYYIMYTKNLKHYLWILKIYVRT